MTRLLFAILAIAICSTAVHEMDDDDLDEFFQKERDILGGDPGGEEDYRCDPCRPRYVFKDRVYIIERNPELRYQRRPAVQYDVRTIPHGYVLPRGRQYMIERQPSGVNWDPSLSDAAQYIFVE